jgi:nitrogen regulatory protein PII
MKLVCAYIQPHKLSDVTLALHRTPGVTGMTVVDVRGWGRRHQQEEVEHPDRYTGEFDKHCRLEVLCADSIATDAVQAVCAAAHTGLQGDGVIYVIEAIEAVRISNSESGDAVVQ